MRTVFLLLIINIALQVRGQEIYDCDNRSYADKFSDYYCDECVDSLLPDVELFISKHSNYRLNLPAAYKLIEYAKDEKIVAYNVEATQNFQSLSVQVKYNQYHPTFDAYFLDYINNTFTDLILKENEFFSYGNAYTGNLSGKYLFHEFVNDDVSVFSLKFFFYHRRKVYVVDFIGKKEDYFNLLCKYLDILYSLELKQ